MRWRSWNELPKEMQVPEVRKYYEILSKKKNSLRIKRIFDVIVSLIMLACVSPIMFALALAIKLDSPGEIFYRQERITQYGKRFRIHKFRTMVTNAEKMGTQVTVKNDARITRVGKGLRKYRLDELPQLIDILIGDMSFVGTRPEVTKYVKQYKPEYMATFLLPAGVTSEASIKYKDEDRLLENAENVDAVYVNKVLPEKMKYNLESIKKFSFLREIWTIVKTVFAVMKKDKAANISTTEWKGEVKKTRSKSRIDGVKIVELKNRDRIPEVVEVHMRSFSGFFLTFLGKGFLKQLYTGFMNYQGSGLLVAIDNNKVKGFLAYSDDLSGFYKYLIKKKFLPFAWYAGCAFLRKPQIIVRLLRAFAYSDDAIRSEKYIELSSIGVLPETEGIGVGSKLITVLKTKAATLNKKQNEKYEYIKLETDAIDNDGANYFYQKNGFLLDHEYETPEGRKMNEYRYYLGKEGDRK